MIVQSGQRVLPPLGDFHIFYFKKEGLEFFHEILKKNVSSLKVELNLFFVRVQYNLILVGIRHTEFLIQLGRYCGVLTRLSWLTSRCRFETS